MTIKTLLTASVLMLVPMVAQAQCSYGSQEASMSCAEGTTWDAEAMSCVAVASS